MFKNVLEWNNFCKIVIRNCIPGNTWIFHSISLGYFFEYLQKQHLILYAVGVVTSLLCTSAVIVQAVMCSRTLRWWSWLLLYQVPFDWNLVLCIVKLDLQKFKQRSFEAEPNKSFKTSALEQKTNPLLIKRAFFGIKLITKHDREGLLSYWNHLNCWKLQKKKIRMICFRFNHKLCCYFWLHILIVGSYLSLVTQVHLLDFERQLKNEVRESTARIKPSWFSFQIPSILCVWNCQ